MEKNAMRDLSDGYVVGITIYIPADGDPNFFANGLRQNVIFLYQLFAADPKCKRVFLLNHGDGELSPNKEIPGVPREALVRTPTVLDQLDLVIGIGAAIDRETVMQLRVRGCKFVAYKAGNAAVISMEAILSHPPRGDAEPYFDYDFWDEIWMIPQHIHTYKGWAETVYRCEVKEVPQIWGTLFIDTMSETVKLRNGFKGGGAWRVGVMDPNITVMKTSHMPMLVCEAAYRLKPDLFKAAYITNAIQFRAQPHFKSFAGALTITKAGILTAEPRFVGIEFLANHCDAVVTHHWENGLNYLYYEVLHGDYPLIHNSEFLKDFGYYYSSFDAEGGARVLIDAWENHDGNLASYRKNNARLFEKLNPASAYAIGVHSDLARALMGKPGARKAS